MNARQDAINAVTNYKSNGQALDFRETPTGALFASNVFSDKAMKDRVPKAVFKALQKTIKLGEKLDASVADAVAAAMKEWAIEKGRHPLCPRLLPADRADGRKARQLHVAQRRRQCVGRVQRQRTDPGRARRFELPLGRHSGHVRGPRLHGLGSDQPGLYPGKPQRHDALHSHRVLLVDRRGTRQENAAAAVDAGAQQARAADSEAVRPHERHAGDRHRRARAGIFPDRPQLLLLAARPADRPAARSLAPSPPRARNSKITTSARFPSGCWPACSKASASCSSWACRSKRGTTKWLRRSTKLRRSSRTPTSPPIISS